MVWTVRPTEKRGDHGYRRHPDQDRAATHHPVVIIGGGMVGLIIALDLMRQGVRPVILERTATVSEGSRSICQAKRTLEIWDRLGVGEAMQAQGVTWKVGRVYHRDRELYRFDLLPEPGHKMPAFVNLQQYHLENRLVAALEALGADLRWRHGMAAVESRADGATVTVDTPDGPYTLTCDWLIACDGARSPTRKQLGLDFVGQVFEDKFLIADVRFDAPDFPSDRRFWFEPTFHDGQTVLLHKQPDGLWRLDFQLGWDADVIEEKKPEKVAPRVERALAALGLPGVDFEMEWLSVYVFQCRTLERYVHDRVIFAGDAAHQVSPFGARGGNGGVQDADNLVWKLVRVLDGRARASLLESYGEERLYAAHENILNSTRATDFMTPKTPASRRVRDLVLDMAATQPAARALVNSGRLSVPAHLKESALNTPDEAAFETQIAPGSPCPDAPIDVEGAPAWLLNQLGGDFSVLTADANAPAELKIGGERLRVLRLGIDFADPQGWVKRRYDLTGRTSYLIRPDQHVAGRWRRLDRAALAEAVARATCQERVDA
jgi:3-(3-hydroxy-phenyl)propionate hydroxylase